MENWEREVGVDQSLQTVDTDWGGDAVWQMGRVSNKGLSGKKTMVLDEE